ncbi:MAG TPA: class I SAM-dependent methyltransferase [Candidatus Deferrimicrobium sp.]|nr:class I SAM-dependent methyltransferase [Candidatus Deferrimicrobium sp.]
MKETYWQTIDRIIGPATVEEFDEIGQKATRQAIEQFILDHSYPDTMLLDAGCNTGVEGYRLFQCGFPGLYVGVDSNLKALTHALKNLHGFRATVKLADLESIGFPDRSFDIVLTKDVIEHAATYTAILGELARLTKQWLILSMFIKMHDHGDVIHREPEGFYHNRYHRRQLYGFMAAQGFGEPRVVFEQGQDEVLVFERRETDLSEAG